MRLERLGVPVYDLGSLRSLWEVRTRKYKQRQKKEKERVEKSALVKINQQWQYPACTVRVCGAERWMFCIVTSTETCSWTTAQTHSSLAPRGVPKRSCSGCPYLKEWHGALYQDQPPAKTSLFVFQAAHQLQLPKNAPQRSCPR
ncbi:leucine-rich repeat-containing protein 2-like [Gadus chalcogrammus]|uniref:leucine-rich repeat-containing protein 2-like n=1 Tax=Gadus chalcogrammus TaxID=1042646 RepID=UPI0024C27CA8|nr:leucine-rich repeat-containing protein 2-like [Gadus chalcogrammus]